MFFFFPLQMYLIYPNNHIQNENKNKKGPTLAGLLLLNYLLMRIVYS